MAQKSIDKRHPEANRQGIWTAIRAFGLKTPWTVRELRNETYCTLDQVRDYAEALVSAGYLIKITDIKPAKYALIKDIGRFAPRVTRNGSKVTQGRNRELMWSAMWVMKIFRPKDLAITCSQADCLVSETDAKDYIGHLYKAGYLLLNRKSTPGKQAEYRVNPKKYTGPLPPMVQRIKQVYDQNEKRVVWDSKGGAHD